MRLTVRVAVDMVDVVVVVVKAAIPARVTPAVLDINFRREQSSPGCSVLLLYRACAVESASIPTCKNSQKSFRMKFSSKS